ncbi:Oidioi.mRNA.OKI2018_I69.XSR.g14158.t2.cds [Oikopleura dioica]|uniref:Oidioi.mRNA.OKI2018_I69.XSR.g14158.t2.cds n=1 Tax=Oikopleura dioica TaxID=34765 RepID=A0ABN7SE77_OIKDI|nr:Oidioi.mRNA.OKI2018_I69.XSR.g14158.t2.cds [Oikopleura dioica]
MGLFLDFLSAVRAYMNSFLVVLGCRNRQNPEDFEGQLEFDKKLQETLIAVREQKRMWPFFQGLEEADDKAAFDYLFRHQLENDGKLVENPIDYGLWTLSWNKTPRCASDDSN